MTIGEGIAVAALLVLLVLVIRGIRGSRRCSDRAHHDGWASASGDQPNAD